MDRQSDDRADTGPLALLDRVSFSYDAGATWALSDISLEVARGEHLCILGANGSGKSTLGRLLGGALAPDSGRVELMGRRVFDDSPDRSSRVDPEAYRQARHRIGMVFQSPEDQIVTTVTEDDVAFGPENLSTPRIQMETEVVQALKAVGMEERADDDPTLMSGGQQQRVAIAGSLAMRPGMLIMDEPGAMLDAGGRADMAAIMDRLVRAGGTVIHITHLTEEAARADRVIVLDHGRIKAEGNPAQVLTSMGLTGEHPGAPIPPGPENRAITGADVEDAGRSATAGPAGMPGPGGGSRPDGGTGLDGKTGPNGAGGQEGGEIDCQDLTFTFSEGSGPVLDGVCFTLAGGRTMAVLGPNGSGKSTLARLICALIPPTGGHLEVAGIDVGHQEGTHTRSGARDRLRFLRRQVGYVMQKPEHQLFAETVFQDVAFGPVNQSLSQEEVEVRVRRSLDLLGIADLADRSPFDLSGGQQRLVAIAGVIACRPRVLVLDEVTANLDPLARRRILDLLADLHRRGVTMVMNTHDEDEVRRLADCALLLDRGRVVAEGDVDDVLRDYRHLITAPHPAQEEHRGGKDGADTSVHTRRPSRTGQRAMTGQAGRTGGAGRQDVSGARLPLMVRLDPRVKMVTFFAMMLTAFLIGSPLQLAAGFAATLAVTALSGIKARHLLRSLRAFLYLTPFLAIFNLLVTRTGRVLVRWGPLMVTGDGLWVALIYTCRLALVLVLGAVLILTTTPTQMTDAFESLLGPLGRLGVHTSEISLVLSLALRFIPTLGHELHEVMEAQAARGGSIETGSLSDRTRACAAIVVPVFAAALRHADNLGQALDARCYEGGQGRTHYRLMKVRGEDGLFIGLVAAYAAAILLLALV